MRCSLGLCLVDVPLRPCSLIASCRRSTSQLWWALWSLGSRNGLCVSSRALHQCLESCAGQWPVQWEVWCGSWCASGPVSDFKLYDIQANRACNIIKFQVAWKVQAPQITLPTELMLMGLIFHAFNNADNPEIAMHFMNLIIFRIWPFSITFLYYA